MMKLLKITLILMLGQICSGVAISDWEEVPQESTNCKLYYSEDLKTYKWIGYPDPNYIFEGDRLSYERMVEDENGKDVLVKTWKEPIEIIADLNAETEVFGIDNTGGVERAYAQEFGSSIRGFVWLDGVSGDGEVLLPFTAPCIFMATGDRLNPTLTRIGTDPNEDNYYELATEKGFKTGKTRAFVKSFSGLGGGGDPPATLIAHYKMNEDTANDNDELVTNGNFAGWTTDDPDSWSVTGESGNDPEVSEAATGEAHADTPTPGGGMCNLYTSDSTNVYINQYFTGVIGKKYRVSLNIDTVTTGSFWVKIHQTGWINIVTKTYSSTGLKTFVFTAPVTSMIIQIQVELAATDITIDDVSIKLCAAEDSSDNDHDGLLQEDTDEAHVTGKVNGAFDFDGSSDYLEIADHDDFTPALTAFSISAWVYMHNATNFMIASKGIYNTDAEWFFRTDGTGVLQFWALDESVDSCYIGRRSAVITAYENQWIHLVATYDGGTLPSSIKLYLNSTNVDIGDNDEGDFVAVENLAHVVWIGRFSTTYANGLIDNVTIFSQVLDQSDVNYLWNNGNGREDWPTMPLLLFLQNH